MNLKKVHAVAFMTPLAFAARMKELAYLESETGHADADELMCKLLCSLGYDEGVHVFEEMKRWYA